MSIITRPAAKEFFNRTTWSDTPPPPASDWSDMLDTIAFAGEQDQTTYPLSYLGTAIKACPFWMGTMNSSTSMALADGTLYFIPVYLPYDATITGTKHYQNTAGNFTGDNTNAIGLYSYNSGTGTLTKVAETANDQTIWKGTSSTWRANAFSSSYAAAKGLYYIAILYNTSGQITGPAISAAANAFSANLMGASAPNSGKLWCSITAQTSLPSTQAMSGLTAIVNKPFMALY